MRLDHLLSKEGIKVGVVLLFSYQGASAQPKGRRRGKRSFPDTAGPEGCIRGLDSTEMKRSGMEVESSVADTEK